MKKFFYLLVVSGLFLFPACTDLDLAPEDAFTENEIFKDAEAYKFYLAKLYASYSLTGQDGPSGDTDITIVNDEGFTSYIRAYWKAQELTTDEAVIAWSDAGIRDLHFQNWTSENQFVRVLYYRIALIVSIANDLLKQAEPDRLEANGITDPQDLEAIAAYAAEARYLRALAYWHAMDLFGNVALVQEISAGFPTQSTSKQIFDFIEAELVDIENIIAPARMNDYGRADQAAVWMLQAKLFLNAEARVGENRYNDCIEACKRVMEAGFSLEPEYHQLFRIDNHTSNEIVFSLPSDGLNSQSWGNTTFLVQAAIGGSMNDSDYGVSGGWGGLRTTSAMVEKFVKADDSFDSRASFYTEGQTLEIDDIAEFTQGYAVPKYTNTTLDGVAGSDPTHSDTDFPMFRLADAYLMYAEAVLRGGSGGDEGTALELINQLRDRSNEANITSSELNLDFILDERVRELYWEGHRRVDLIRYNQYTENGIWPWKGNVKEGVTTESFRNIFPIPASDLLANPSLVQNPGY